MFRSPEGGGAILQRVGRTTPSSTTVKNAWSSTSEARRLIKYRNNINFLFPLPIELSSNVVNQRKIHVIVHQLRYRVPLVVNDELERIWKETVVVL